MTARRLNPTVTILFLIIAAALPAACPAALPSGARAAGGLFQQPDAADSELHLRGLPFRSSLYRQPDKNAMAPVSSGKESVPGQLGNYVRPLQTPQDPGFSPTSGAAGLPSVNSGWANSGSRQDPANPFFQSQSGPRPNPGSTGSTQRKPEWPEPDRELFEALGAIDELDEAVDDAAGQVPPDRKRSFETSGRVETIQQRHEDGSIQVERQVTQDSEGNFFSHGSWKLFSPQGQSLAEGAFQFGMMEGPWRRWHPASREGVFAMQPFDQFQGPFLSSVNFTDGRMDGIWQIHDAGRTKIMEIPYELGRRQGTASWWWPNGQKMREIRFDRNLIDGYWIEWNQQGQVIRRDEYLRGRKLVRETEEFSPGQKRLLAWFVDAKLKLDGLDNWWEARPAAYTATGERIQHGPVASWFENGQPLMQGQFRAGKRHGSFSWWHANGQKQLAGQFEQGKKTGLWTWWHESGMKATEGRYIDDVPTGTWTWWDAGGQVTDRKQMGENAPPGPEGPALEPAPKPENSTGILPDGGMEEITPGLPDSPAGGGAQPSLDPQPDAPGKTVDPGSTDPPLNEGSGPLPLLAVPLLNPPPDAAPGAGASVLPAEKPTGQGDLEEIQAIEKSLAPKPEAGTGTTPPSVPNAEK